MPLIKRKKQPRITTASWPKSWISKNFKAPIIAMLKEVKENILRVNKKIKYLIRQVEIIKKEQNVNSRLAE